MLIEQLQVEEGFLRGLNMTFSSGLNVLIGPRGTGKTSVLEMLRFCLGSASLTDKNESLGDAQALSILSSGSASVTVVLDSNRYVSTRTANYVSSDLPANYNAPLFLSQNEIEAVGLSQNSRLALIDGVAKTAMEGNGEVTLLIAQIRSHTREYRSLQEETSNFKAQENKLIQELEGADEVKKAHISALALIENSASDTDRLGILTGWISTVNVRISVLGRIETELQRRYSSIRAIRENLPPLEPWPKAAQCEDPLLEIRALALQSAESVATSEKTIADALLKLRFLRATYAKQCHDFEEEARAMRTRLEGLKQGAGEIARKLSLLQEKTGQLSAVRETTNQRSKRILELRDLRGKLLDRLEVLRNFRFEKRKEAIERLNARLSPRINIRIERGGIVDNYARSLTEALRGSGLKFSDSVQAIVENLSPREFIELVEMGDAEEIADLSGLASARCFKIIERINSSLADEILVADVEDGVTFLLLDGVDYKDSEHLSTGQRCTIVLPLVLQQENLCLIIDQPEDHLDNGFIAETLIPAIRSQKSNGQIIFATHNANIPVLGEADRVTLLGSDGTRGHIVFSGGLMASQSVDAISSIMEGGIAAFRKRADFYSKKGASGHD